MLAIRKNVFETNSSSCHSISFASDSAEGYSGKVLYADGEDFGWEYNVLCTPQKKFSYWVVASLYNIYNQLWKEAKDDYKSKWENDPSYDEWNFPWNTKIVAKYNDKVEYIKKEVEDYFASKDVTIIWRDDDMGFNYGLFAEDHEPSINGYIDHQSAPDEDTLCKDFAELWKSPEELFNFIFNSSTITTDNDNH